MKNSLIIFAFLIVGIASPAKKKVYICTDPKSQIYHFEELCKDLEKCKFEVNEIKMSEAEEQEKRLCKLCKENESKVEKKK